MIWIGEAQKEKTGTFHVRTQTGISRYLNLTPRLHLKRGRGNTISVVTQGPPSHPLPRSLAILRIGMLAEAYGCSRLVSNEAGSYSRTSWCLQRERVGQQSLTKGDSIDLGSLSSIRKPTPQSRSFSVPPILPTDPLKELGFSESTARKRGCLQAPRPGNGSVPLGTTMLGALHLSLDLPPKLCKKGPAGSGFQM